MASNSRIGVEGSRLDLSMTRATDFGPVTVYLTDGDGIPVDLTGATVVVRMQRVGAVGEVIPLGTDIPAPATDGRLVFALPAATTTNLVTGVERYDWNLWIVRGGLTVPIYFGKVTVQEQVL